MSFFQLVRREMQGSSHRLIIMSVLGGASNSAMLAAINSGAQAGSSGRVSLSAAGLFIISLIIFIKAQHFILISATAEIEAIIHKLRLRLMELVRHSELVPLEAIGRAAIEAAITKETALLTQAATSLAFAGQGVVLVFFVTLYVAYLSPLAFALSAAIVSVATALFHAKSHELATGAREASKWENRLFDRLTDLLDGVKEVKLNRARGDDLFDDSVEVSRNAANIKIKNKSETFKRMVIANSSLYIVLGAIVFVVPTLSDMQGGGITKTTTALIFVVGACFGIVQMIPILAGANSAAANIERLEARLRVNADVSEVDTSEPSKRFGKIEMRNIIFRYLDKSSEAVFQVGPVDFTLRSGELVFIAGGNGSGKSTFLKLLASLYEPDSGEITFDGVRVGDGTREAYRTLIAAIFSDYHLFQRLYGIPDPDPAEIDLLLTKFQLFDKTRITDGEFSSLDLSGGQRRRLALVVSLLEKRPILLLDEWTAEQDPEFRRKFYDDVLPALSLAGVTVVMVTHDDRYLNELTLPARRLRMDEGRFVDQDTGENG
jgi:putative pyoverdin transport system ATP-binding/permease protein